MRSRLEDEEQTVVIAATLGLFALVLLLGVGAYLLLGMSTRLSAGFQQVFSIAVVVAAAMISLRYLVRNSRP